MRTFYDRRFHYGREPRRVVVAASSDDISKYTRKWEDRMEKYREDEDSQEYPDDHYEKESTILRSIVSLLVRVIKNRCFHETIV